MAERKITVYYDSSDGRVDEEAFFDYVHRFFCKDFSFEDMEDCRLLSMTSQNVVEEE